MEIPSGDSGADHIITALNDGGGEVRNLVEVIEQPIVVWEKAAMEEVVTLNSRKREDGARIIRTVDSLWRGVELPAAHLPLSPSLGGLEADRWAGVGEAFVIGADDIIAFFVGDKRDKIFPIIGIDGTGSAFIKPREFLAAEQEDPAQDQAETAFGVLDRIGQRKGGTPATAKEYPSFDIEVAADRFHIVDQVPRRVVFERIVGCAFAATALVKEDDAPFIGVKEATAIRRASTSGAAMNVQDGQAFGIARFFDVDLMGRRDS